MWLDANTHAGEVTGCTAVLDFANTVLTGYGAKDPALTRLLETSTLYILPRLCPDGSELYLTTPYTCRSTPILWPGAALYCPRARLCCPVQFHKSSCSAKPVTLSSTFVAGA